MSTSTGEATLVGVDAVGSNDGKVGMFAADRMLLSVQAWKHLRYHLDACRPDQMVAIDMLHTVAMYEGGR